jgi:hypothetical protein
MDSSSWSRCCEAVTLNSVYVRDGTRRTVSKGAVAAEIATSNMPMRIIKADFESQSAVFEWLTTN